VGRPRGKGVAPPETDVGHIFTGLDAMLAPAPATVPGLLTYNMSNVEWVTWAGDVGSAAAEWAFGAVAGKWDGARLDELFNHFAGPADLVGDLDSFAIRVGLGGAPPAGRLRAPNPLPGPLSAVLLDYYRVNATSLGAARGRRERDFVEAYGAIVVGGKLTNRAALVARLRGPVYEFASAYSLGRFYKSGFPSRPADFNPLLQFAIGQMTARFVDWLAARL
jgi:hypothetical protein